ncbi:hypothetical protein LR48_Vigan04g105300 [Vigna angularis]|uniref:Putative plant transposon protein domain-containing protein n=1 Tax=Phaseolus angularis TaxID=3914 RepID=A0A0L9UD38_PHAAN|nr:hypothetical protein LR48_Vigan04g105300 [Vigna angularis]
MEEGVDFGDVESVLCVLGGHFQRNRNDITVSRVLLLYCVLKGMSINIGQVIDNEIQVCANTMNNKAPLGHLSLIAHLCELAGVNMSTLPFERPRKAIDEAYYRQYCGGDEAAQPLPPRHPRRGRGPPQAPAQPHDDIDGPWRSSTMWWHGQEQAQASGAGAAEAPAMDDDDDDEFEDAEDDGEEEDSDDNMG